MQLISDDGASVELSVGGYQYPSLPGGSDRGDMADWDANWLLVRGSVRTTDGDSWTFSEPCLTTREAAALVGFLLRVAAGDASTRVDGAGAERTLKFVEPDIAFNEVDIKSNPRTIEVHLSHGCAPPADPHQSTFVDEPAARVGIRMGSQGWQSAAKAWAIELSAHPER